MDPIEETEEEFSPIIRIFERLTFERGQEIHDQVSTLTELFSSSDVITQLTKEIFFGLCFDYLGDIRHVRYIDRMCEDYFCSSKYQQEHTNIRFLNHFNTCDTSEL